MPWAKEGITSMILPVFFKHPVTLRCIKIHSTNWLKEIVKEFIDQVFRCDELQNFLGLEVKDWLASVEMAIITKSKITILTAGSFPPPFPREKISANNFQRSHHRFTSTHRNRHLTSRIGPWIQTHLGWFRLFPYPKLGTQQDKRKGNLKPLLRSGCRRRSSKSTASAARRWNWCMAHLLIPFHSAAGPSVLWPPLHSASPNAPQGSTSSHREQSLVFDHHQPRGSAFITKKIWTSMKHRNPRGHNFPEWIPSWKSARSFLRQFSQTSTLKSSTSFDILGYTQTLTNTWDHQVLWSTSKGTYIEVRLLADYLPLLEMIENKISNFFFPKWYLVILKKATKNQQQQTKQQKSQVIWSLARFVLPNSNPL